ncbi:MAG TPA: adventurous gliding motility protein GltJ [Myxococcaceae bacterium]|nr:adventurous gliding motility protein GltJ [Myxococcaceae bacterium]
MRFVCDSCRAQYMISDDKVGANGVKVRCKKCGNVIVVRRPQDAEDDAALQGLEESAPPPPAPEAPTGENSIFSDVDDEEIGAAFDSALGERRDDEPVGQPPAEEPPPVEANLPPVSDGPPRALDWYVAIDDKQTGPLTPEAIKDYWDRGEIGPDSLTWRQGFEDWVPLSEVSELAAWLAPRPQRPVFSPASSPSGPMPVVPVPIESAFNAGGVMRTVRSEVPTPVPQAAGGWRPSASAALASLVKEEIDALSKPDAPPPAPEPVAAPRGLLEVPPPTGEVPAASINGRPSRAEAPTPVTAVERPPTFTPAYPYATRPVKAQGNKGLLIGLGVAVLVVLGAVGGGGWYLLQRQKAAEQAARQLPPPPETAKVTPPSEPPKATQAAATTTLAPATTPAVTPPVTPPVAKVTPAVPPSEGNGTRRGTRGSRHTGGSKASGGGEEQVASADPPPKSSGNGKSKADDLFDEVFGTGTSGSKSADSRSNGKKTAYVPPAPGASSTEVPERLPKGDIMSVVLANKPSIVRCVNEQKTRDPNLHGTLVMHWVIQTSGKTTSVSAVTDQFKSSYMATCLSGLVKSWNFPKHKYQPGEPVDFPFTF